MNEELTKTVGRFIDLIINGNSPRERVYGVLKTVESSSRMKMEKDLLYKVIQELIKCSGKLAVLHRKHMAYCFNKQLF